MFSAGFSTSVRERSGSHLHNHVWHGELYMPHFTVLYTVVAVTGLVVSTFCHNIIITYDVLNTRIQRVSLYLRAVMLIS